MVSVRLGLLANNTFLAGDRLFKCAKDLGRYPKDLRGILATAVDHFGEEIVYKTHDSTTMRDGRYVYLDYWDNEIEYHPKVAVSDKKVLEEVMVSPGADGESGIVDGAIADAEASADNIYVDEKTRQPVRKTWLDKVTVAQVPTDDESSRAPPD